MKVLSLFDGISCGRVALENIGISQSEYYAAEIDKYATTMSEKNYPDIIRLGDVTKWREWSIPWHEIDMVFAGFPCQAWSLAGKQLGDKDERGMLFWTMLDIITHVKYMKRLFTGSDHVDFLIENVKMKKEFEEYITQHTEQALGTVYKTLINSALVSAQNRNRYYWTSWSVTQPEDRGVMLADIIEDGVGFIKSHGEMIKRNSKSQCLDANYHKGVDNHGQRTVIKCGSMTGRRINPETGKRDDNNPDLKAVQRIELRSDNKTGTLTTVQKDNYVVTAITDGVSYRKLTPIECERLQGLPDNYTNHVSNTQRYKALGNGWQVTTVEHILKEYLNR